jgi:hypothetical protein
VAVAPGAVADLVQRLTDGGLGELVLRVEGAAVGVARSTRAIGRARRWAGRVDDVVGLAFGREDVELPLVPVRRDMAGFLAADWE